MEQRTTEWYLARKGKFTSSEISNLLVTSKKKDEIFGDTALTYIKKKVAENVMNDNVFLGIQSFSCAATQWGEMYEDEARNIYSSRKGVDVEQTGFIQYTKYSGGSPDGVVQSDNGLIEIKCPYNPEKHIDFMLMETQEDLLTLNKQYYYQCQANMLFCNKDYIDFVSYDPRLSELISMKILRINPDYKAFALIESRIELAQERLEEMVSNLTKIGIEQLKLS